MIAFLCISTLSSCKKDKGDNSSGKTKTELLTSGTWKIKAFSSNPAYDWDGDGDTETDIFGAMDGCEKDGYYTFKSNGTFEVNEGATKCEADDNQTETGNWNFIADETKINFDGEEYTLLELTGSTLKIKDVYTDDGVDYTDEITFGH